VFRSPSMAQHAVVAINNTEWITGGCDGTLQVWCGGGGGGGGVCGGGGGGSMSGLP
jgi:hypothetical protein